VEKNPILFEVSERDNNIILNYGKKQDQLTKGRQPHFLSSSLKEITIKIKITGKSSKD
jgi:hypothetical protein